MDKQRVRHKSKKRILIHNDLGNAAYYHRNVIEKKLGADDREGIGFDCMACLIMLAFGFEAQINFVGARLIEGWKERRPFAEKVEEVFTRLGLERDAAARPFASVERLKLFRDSLAHGKPVDVEIDEVVDAAQSEFAQYADLDGDWQKFCTPEGVFETYEDLESLWKEMLERGGIPVIETVTHGMTTMSMVTQPH
jgi:hypothetical protein